MGSYKVAVGLSSVAWAIQSVMWGIRRALGLLVPLPKLYESLITALYT